MIELLAPIVRTAALGTIQIINNSRYLSAEDLIFLIRHDRAKVNRLRTYLSWKDVRRHAKDSGGDGAAGMEVETLEDGADGELSIIAGILPRSALTNVKIN